MLLKIQIWWRREFVSVSETVSRRVASAQDETRLFKNKTAAIKLNSYSSFTIEFIGFVRYTVEQTERDVSKLDF